MKTPSMPSTIMTHSIVLDGSDTIKHTYMHTCLYSYVWAVLDANTFDSTTDFLVQSPSGTRKLRRDVPVLIFANEEQSRPNPITALLCTAERIPAMASLSYIGVARWIEGNLQSTGADLSPRPHSRWSKQVHVIVEAVASGLCIDYVEPPGTISRRSRMLGDLSFSSKELNHLELLQKVHGHV